MRFGRSTLAWLLAVAILLASSPLAMVAEKPAFEPAFEVYQRDGVTVRSWRAPNAKAKEQFTRWLGLGQDTLGILSATDSVTYEFDYSEEYSDLPNWYPLIVSDPYNDGDLYTKSEIELKDWSPYASPETLAFDGLVWGYWSGSNPATVDELTVQPTVKIRYGSCNATVDISWGGGISLGCTSGIETHQYAEQRDNDVDYLEINFSVYGEHEGIISGFDWARVIGDSTFRFGSIATVVTSIVTVDLVI